MTERPFADDLHDRIASRDRTRLEALQAAVEIPIRVNTDVTEDSP